jgi:hypothetical protein
MSTNPTDPDQLISREDLTAQLEAFAKGWLTLDDLRRWFTPLLVAETTEAVAADRDLVFRLIFLFEDDSLSGDAHRCNAWRLSRALRAVESNSELIELIPVVTDQERLCAVVGKYRRGIISRTGFLSAISEARYSRRVKDWLVAADVAGLQFLCKVLSAGEYETVGLITGMR